MTSNSEAEDMGSKIIAKKMCACEDDTTCSSLNENTDNKQLKQVTTGDGISSKLT